MSPPAVVFQALSAKQVLLHVGVGMGCASFWRGAWYILDDNLFPNNKQQSACASFGLGILGITASQGLLHKLETVSSLVQQSSRHKMVASSFPKVARFGALYTVAMSCVLIWRGTWLGWDIFYEMTHPQNNQNEASNKALVVAASDPGHATTSGALSHVVAVTCLVGAGFFAAVLAPPAATGIVRDLAVKGGTSTTRAAYQGPAGPLLHAIFHSSTVANNNATSRRLVTTLAQEQRYAAQNPFKMSTTKSGNGSSITTTNHKRILNHSHHPQSPSFQFSSSSYNNNYIAKQIYTTLPKQPF